MAASDHPGSGRTVLKSVLGVAIGAVCLWLAFRQMSLTEVLAVLSVVQPGAVMVAIVAIIGATVLRAWRWKLLFPPGEREMRFFELWRILVVGQMINIIMPSRLGELYRLYRVERSENRSVPETAGTIGIEKAFDALVFLVLIFLTFFEATLPANLREARRAAILTSGGLFAGLSLFWLLGMRVLYALERVASFFGELPQRLIERWLRPLFIGLSATRDWRRFVSVLSASFLTWGAAWLANYACLVALKINGSPAAALTVLVVVLSGTVITTSPGNIGVFEYLCVVALSAFQVSRPEAVSYGILLHTVAYIPPVAIGAGVLLLKTLPSEKR